MMQANASLAAALVIEDRIITRMQTEQPESVKQEQQVCES